MTSNMLRDIKEKTSQSEIMVTVIFFCNDKTPIPFNILLFKEFIGKNFGILMCRDTY